MAITRVGSQSAIVDTSAPSGMLAPFAGSSAPSGWLLCDGAAVSRSTYASLFAVVGTTYGAGNGSTTFNLPDLRGRIPVGKNAGTFVSLGGTGGVETVTLTADQSGLPAHAHPAGGSSGTAGGHTHTASTGSAGSHQHYYNRPSFGTTSAANGGGTTGLYNSATFSNVNTTDSSPAPAHTHTVSIGSGGDHSHGISVVVSNNTAAAAASAHSNLQPYIVLNWIVKE